MSGFIRLISLAHQLKKAYKLRRFSIVFILLRLLPFLILTTKQSLHKGTSHQYLRKPPKY
jgi:hypothetical protein